QVERDAELRGVVAGVELAPLDAGLALVPRRAQADDVVARMRLDTDDGRAVVGHVLDGDRPDAGPGEVEDLQVRERERRVGRERHGSDDARAPERVHVVAAQLAPDVGVVLPGLRPPAQGKTIRRRTPREPTKGPPRRRESPWRTGNACAFMSVHTIAACAFTTTRWPRPLRPRARCASSVPTAASAPAWQNACQSRRRTGGRSSSPQRYMEPPVAAIATSSAWSARPGARSAEGVTLVGTSTGRAAAD